MGLVERLGVRQIGQRHRSFGLTSDHRPGTAVIALDAIALGHGPVHHEGVRFGQLHPGLADSHRHLPDERPQPLAVHRGDARSVEGHARLREVSTRAHHDARTLEQLGLVVAELGQQDPLLLRGVVRRQRGEVEQQDEDPGALDVAQELVPQPAALTGPLDEPGEVGHHELGLVVEADDTQVGLEGGEGVVGDLGLGGRDRRDQRRLADAREADQGDVGHELELEAQPPLLPDLPLLGEGRGTPAVREEAGVAAPAPASFRRQPALAGVEEVGQHGAALVAHTGALGHGHLEVASAAPVLALPLPVGAALAGAVRVVLERDQRRHVAIDDQPDATARAAVTAVGPAEGNVRLPPEAHRSRAAVASLDMEPTLIDELRHQVEASGGSTAETVEHANGRRSCQKGPATSRDLCRLQEAPRHQAPRRRSSGTHFR